MAVSFDFQFACGLAAYCCRRGPVGDVSTSSPKDEKPEDSTHLQVGADISRDDLRDLRLELFHERFVKVARSLPPRLAAWITRASACQQRALGRHVRHESLTRRVEVAANILGRVILEQFLFESPQRHVRQDDLFAEGFERLLTLKEGLLRRHLDDRAEERGGLGDELRKRYEDRASVPRPEKHTDRDGKKKGGHSRYHT